MDYPVLFLFQELPWNSYFGGSLCSVDINNDGLDDLLVGAPLYSPNSGASEIGAVLVYMGNRNVRSNHLLQLYLSSIQAKAV